MLLPRTYPPAFGRRLVKIWKDAEVEPLCSLRPNSIHEYDMHACAILVLICIYIYTCWQEEATTARTSNRPGDL